MFERTAEDWDRVAVALPGFSWAGCDAWYAPRGSQGRRWDLEAGKAVKVHVLMHGAIGAPEAVRCVTANGEALQSGIKVFDHTADTLVLRDTPATAGVLLHLLGPLGQVMHALNEAGRDDLWSSLMYALMHNHGATGRAAIAAAEALGRWPGGYDV